MALSNVRHPYDALGGGTPASAGSRVTLGEHLRGQVRRLCEAAGFAPPAGPSGSPLLELLDLLGPAALRPLGAGPPSPSFVCDDHSPAEISLACSAGRPVAVRLLVEPGCAAGSLDENARQGLAALGGLADRRGFSTEPVRRVEDLFFPPLMHGPFALWCATEQRREPGAPRGVKVYLNPRAHGRAAAARVTEEALRRFGFGRAWAALRERVLPRGPERDEIRFFALDLGDWHTPRIKVYVAHHDATASQLRDVARVLPGAAAERAGAFCRSVAGDPGRFSRRPLVSCLAFTDRDAEGPGGHTVHVPVRDYARDDGVARERATTALRRLGVDAGVLDGALAAMTSRRLSDGVGLIAYVSLVQSTWEPPRVNVYLSPEAYAVRRPRTAGRRTGGPR
ncbi:tryptophan dimethylallyltransferase family protein [Streptomyces sp. NPDC057794]|uniref:tryptophan dimethylallyltransferase family protein n=1 Tax=Streptomyces sp. NPDC057794 TaxID=3346251 RepID=UPI0036B826F4